MQTTIDCVAYESLLNDRFSIMTPQVIDHSTLARLVESGLIDSAHIVGQQGGWAVQVKHGAHEHALTAQRSGQLRLFKRFETLVTYLQGVGINHFDVDASGYDPLKVKTYTRPDRSEALKQAHEAAAYEDWFKAQVQASIDDPRPSVSDEDARSIFAARREALRQRAR